MRPQVRQPSPHEAGHRRRISFERGTMYFVVTAILAVLLAGFGASFAIFCRLPGLDEEALSESEQGLSGRR